MIKVLLRYTVWVDIFEEFVDISTKLDYKNFEDLISLHMHCNNIAHKKIAHMSSWKDDQF